MRSLVVQRAVIQTHLAGLTHAELRWKSAPEEWCALEIVCHLHDEELHDFRARLKHVLTTPAARLPATDPVGWVQSRKYMEQDPDIVLEQFLAERARSVEWLRSLKSAPWGNVHKHPQAGPLSADLFLANWVAHDLHHLRQSIHLRYAHLSSICDTPSDYAGVW